MILLRPNPNQQPLDLRLRLSRRLLFGLIAVALIAGASGPTAAQDEDPTSDKLDEIREEREALEGELAETARGIDGTMAEIGELTEAMATLETVINKQEIAVKVAQARSANAERQFERSAAAVTAAEEALVDLEKQIRERAVEAFVGQDVGTPDIVYTNTPNLTVRMESLLNAVLRGDADIADAYAAVQNELALERETARLARIEAEQFRARAEADQRRLESDREIQEALWMASQARLDHLLFEQQSREELKIQLDEDEKREIARLAEQLSRYSGPGGIAGPVATPDEIEWVYGIAVHNSIAGNLKEMLDAAQADGITFRGGGYRDASAQIRLRKAHCGSSDYAIWQAPPSACRPPTARPGSSNHERGLAIDFTDDGRSINDRNSRGYKWLKANAADYGFFNLPSEPWHWSTTGT
ncbi:MAG: hypothetical protein HKN03_17345 [Acidimicrobiales bacterium]|nr:hypothetical protein [Acidimicrobiales bacterium]